MSHAHVATKESQTSLLSEEVKATGTFTTIVEPSFSTAISSFAAKEWSANRFYGVATRRSLAEDLVLKWKGMLPRPKLWLLPISFLPSYFSICTEILFPSIRGAFIRWIAFLASHSVLEWTKSNPVDSPSTLFRGKKISNTTWHLLRGNGHRSILVTTRGRLETNKDQQSWIQYRFVIRQNHHFHMNNGFGCSLPPWLPERRDHERRPMREREGVQYKQQRFSSVSLELFRNDNMKCLRFRNLATLTLDHFPLLSQKHPWISP